MPIKPTVRQMASGWLLSKQKLTSTGEDVENQTSRSPERKTVRNDPTTLRPYDPMTRQLLLWGHTPQD